MAKLLDYNATLAGRVDLEDTLAVFTVEPDQPTARRGARAAETGSGGWFIPGQYVTIGMNRGDAHPPADDRPQSVRRAMSIASAPEVEGVYELYIRFVSEPESPLPLTHVMWPIQIGERLFCRPGATGKFTIPDTIGECDRRLKLMVAAGTGLAPFISMARSRVLRDPAARLDDMAILHGASYASSLGYRAELEELSARNGLRYLPTISRPQSDPAWTGLAGRVESLLDPDRIADTERLVGLGPGELCPAHAAVFICGLQGTIANTIINLLTRGYVPDNRRLRRALGLEDRDASTIFWEQYDTVPVIDLKDEALMDRLRAITAR